MLAGLSPGCLLCFLAPLAAYTKLAACSSPEQGHCLQVVVAAGSLDSVLDGMAARQHGRYRPLVLVHASRLASCPAQPLPSCSTWGFKTQYAEGVSAHAVLSSQALPLTAKQSMLRRMSFWGCWQRMRRQLGLMQGPSC